MSVTFHQESTTDLLLNMAAASINKLLADYYEIPKLLLFSGGSALDIVNMINIKLISNICNTTIGVLDERYSTIPSINNFEKLSETKFYLSLMKDCFKEINTRVKEGESLEQFALRYNNELDSWIKNHQGGKVIITQGIGPDAHTSGIMPFPENPDLFNQLFNSEKLVVGYDAGAKDEFPQRATTTISFLKNYVDHSIIYMSGENKLDALKKVYDPNLKINDAPGKVILEMKDVELFTDIIAFKTP